ncbi:30S ribosomal protein S1 [Latilactobacillus fuchuensis]|uniref:RNA degradation presenting factor (Ribosomal protein S1 homolog) n=2 Tax=Latilactobacillus fuchuensis TaxID=164393 RepID=A0A2N9DVJ2_9LACO|nr:30S ribosomal protein S1 [Latilactobacillus fuchuensis]KRL58410.1 rpsA protein [Latilactobacillus fuchuensis DSM 14340 = JCM 11249]SPC38552.1 RNA degradation presenting factor (ribosomal protein S1 homolog) [Latilactobacillus fuchuensis]
MSDANLNETQSSEAMAAALNSVHEVKIGDVVQGEVLAIEDRQVIVGIQGTGVEGVVPQKELSSQPIDQLSDIVKVGDEMALVVISTIGNDKENGSYLLSKRRLEARKIWAEIEAKFTNQETVTATVSSVVKGGLVVDVEGVRGFVPASMISDRFVRNLDGYKGQEMTLQIIEIEPSENRLILSRKALVEQERKAQLQAVFEKLLPGDIIEGEVARLTNFGAFIDLGGVDGLVHVSEISYDHIKQPADVLTVGETVKVKVLALDQEKGRISLSIKDTQPGPWDEIAEKAPVGSVLEGVVKRLTTFGAFVEVFPGVEGLVHISQISHQHIATPNDVLEEGQTVQVKVLNVDPDQQRLGLSIKALQEKPAGAKDSEPKDVAPSDYQMPEEESGFSIGDLIGKSLDK